MPNNSRPMELTNVLIFSKDRAAQLDALLRSVREKVEDWQRRGCWTVIYKASSPEFAAAYEQLKQEHYSPALEFIDESTSDTAFKSIVVKTLKQQHQRNAAQWCTFLVDDMIFKSPWPVADSKAMQRLKDDARVLCFSMRLCPRYRFCYAENRRVRPPFMARYGCWNWRQASGDWGYPMSVDGHVFRYADLIPLVEQIEFRHPNSFEDELSKRPLMQRPLMTCNPEAIVVNLPINRVQHEFKNRAGEEHGISAETLNAAYLNGKRVNLEPVYALTDNRGCHHEMPIQLI